MMFLQRHRKTPEARSDFLKRRGLVHKSNQKTDLTPADMWNSGK